MWKIGYHLLIVLFFFSTTSPANKTTKSNGILLFEINPVHGCVGQCASHLNSLFYQGPLDQFCVSCHAETLPAAALVAKHTFRVG